MDGQVLGARRGDLASKISLALLAMLISVGLIGQINQARAAGFNSNALVTQNFGSVASHDEPVATVALASGKILAFGQTSAGDGDTDLLLARFNDTGTLDSSFGGGDGFVTKDFEGSAESPGGFLVQPDGRIVVVGSTGDQVFFDSSRTLVARYTADGDVDSTFGTGGQTILTQQRGHAVARMANGKLLVGGSHEFDFSLTALNQDGSIDTTFGTGGRVETDMAGQWESAQIKSVTVQSDGKIVVGGGGGAYEDSEFMLARYSSGGVIDTSFGSAGIVKVPLDGGEFVEVKEVRVQSDGKIVVAGDAYFDDSDAVIVRLSASGSLDSSFGDGDGIAIFDSEGFDELQDLIVQPDGKLVFTGTFDWNFAVIRVGSNGAMDSSFDGDGIVSSYEIANGSALAIKTDGTLIAAGSLPKNGGTSAMLAAYNSNGTIRTAFGEDGVSETSFGTNPSNDKGWEVLEQPDGKILVAGTTNTGDGLDDLLLYRFTSNGEIDTTFGGGDGAVTSDGSSNEASVALQPDGKILLGGGGSGNFEIGRFNSDGSIDNSFGTGGKVSVSLWDGPNYRSSRLRSIAVQPNGKIVAVGDSGNFFYSEITVARFNTDGQLDTSFGSGTGYVFADPGGNSSASDVVLLADGKILVGGDNGSEMVLARFQSNGVLDPSFNSDGIASGAPSWSAYSINAIALRSDQKILVAGSADFNPIVARFTADGDLDPTFGDDGAMKPGSFTATAATDLETLPNGKTYVAIGRRNGGTSDIVGIARVNSDGSSDTSFGGDGYVADDFGGENDEATGLELRSNGKLLLTGFKNQPLVDYADIALLQFDPVAVPANDNLANAQPLTGPGRITSTNFNATHEPGEPNHGSQDGSSSVWFSWTPVASRAAEIDVCENGASESRKYVAVYEGSSIGTLSSVRFAHCEALFSATAGTTYKIAVDDWLEHDQSRFKLDLSTIEPPTNDSFSNAETLTGLTDSTMGDLYGATRESGEPIHNRYNGVSNLASVWYTWTAPDDGAVKIDVCDKDGTWGPLMGFYTGSSLVALEEVNEGAWSCRGYFQAAAGTTYKIAIDTDPFFGGDLGPFNLELSYVPPPANDNFASAQVLTGTSGSGTTNTEGATHETGEPNHNDNPYYGANSRASVWYQWTAPSTGTLRLEAGGPGGSFVGAIYIGTNVAALTERGASSGTVYANVTAGTNYKIALDSYTSDSRGEIEFSWDLLGLRPANDNFANSQALNGTTAEADGDIRTSTHENNEPEHGGDSQINGDSSVWYHWTAPASGVVSLDVASGDFNPAASIYSGTGLGALTEIASGQYELYAPVTAGVTYRIAVDSTRAGARDEFSLELELFTGHPANDNFENAATITGTSSLMTGNVTTATKQPGEPAHEWSGESSVWYRWTAPQSGLVSIAACDTTTFSPTIGVYTGSTLSGLNRIISGYCGVSFVAEAGTQYKIAIDGPNPNSRGEFEATLDFGSRNYIYETWVSPSQKGLVTASTGGVNCSSYCWYSFDAGTTVTFTATPASGYYFIGWTGGTCSGTGPCVVTTNKSGWIEAQFSNEPAEETRTLSVSKSGSGSGSVASNPAGISCGTTCSADFALDSQVTLTAQAAEGSTFEGWTGACSGTGTCQVTMSQARNVGAAFEEIVTPPAKHLLSVVKAGNGQGTITSSPSGVNCGSDCSEELDENTVVTLTATPATASTFTGWSGACSGTSSCQITMSEAKSVTGTFTTNEVPPPIFALTVTKTGSGQGTVSSSPAGINCGSDCSEQLEQGSVITLTATPATGSTFVGWGGACSGSGTCQVTMTQSKSVSANFDKTPTPPPGPPKLSVSVSPKKLGVKAGKKARFKVQVRNTGSSDATGTKLCVTVPSSKKKTVKAPGCKTIGSLAKGTSKSVTFQIATTKKARGTTKLTFSASASNASKASATGQLTARKR